MSNVATVWYILYWDNLQSVWKYFGTATGETAEEALTKSKLDSSRYTPKVAMFQLKDATHFDRGGWVERD